jgi:NAD(P)-dependent dehydrogenase (short-subunit alcohol dehydrogenase family)
MMPKEVDEGRRSTRRPRVALVTGANRGIGFAIAKQLADQGIDVILGSRDIARGEGAAAMIASSASMNARVLVVYLDLMQQYTVYRLATRVDSDFGKLDILVNNAGIFMDETHLPSETDFEVVRTTLETNLLGPWRLCQKFIPSMKQNNYGRVVNVSSGAGALGDMAKSLYAPAYRLSKASLNALTILLANEVKDSPNILVNAVNPGWVRTDMGGTGAPRSPDEGADTAVWLATLPEGGPSGGFFSDRTRIEW